MRFVTHINNVKCLEWGINANQGAVFDLFNQMASWAKATILDGETYYWVSREKVVEELPLYCQKTDTVYRYFKEFAEKGLILYQKIGHQDLISITEKGSEWNSTNSETNPTLGNKSDIRKSIRENSEIDPKNSDLNPTDKYINNNIQDQNPPVAPQGAAPAQAVLDYLNSALATLADQLGEHKPVCFKLVDGVRKAIGARITEFSQADCERVIDYLVAKWGRDEKMRDYIKPKTIFRPSNFAEYVPMSLAWSERGRPVSINGKLVRSADVEKIANLPSVETVHQFYLRSLGMGNPFKQLDFSHPHDKILYYAVIGTKSKKPLERDLRNVIVSEINAVAERIDQLKTPNFSQA